MQRALRCPHYCEFAFRMPGHRQQPAIQVWEGGVISQPRLPFLNAKEPEAAVVTCHSNTVCEPCGQITCNQSEKGSSYYEQMADKRRSNVLIVFLFMENAGLRRKCKELGSRRLGSTTRAVRTERNQANYLSAASPLCSQSFQIVLTAVGAACLQEKVWQPWPRLPHPGHPYDA